MTYVTSLRILSDNPFVELSDHSTYTERNFKSLFQHLLTERKWTSMTYNRNLKNIRMYCGYLKENGVLAENPLSKMRLRQVPRQLPKALDREQVSLLLHALNRICPASSDFVTERNRAMIYVYLFT